MSAPPSPLEAARALAPRLRAAAAETERARRLAPALVDALAAAGLFRLCVPRALGGLEAEPATLLTTIEEASRADGSAGWVLMIGATSGLVAAYRPESEAREIYGKDPGVVTGGVFAPRGRAATVEGGFRASGRWPFASGCEHCGWLMGGCVVLEDGRPQLLPNGVPESRMVLLPASEWRVHDTWNVSGLRGTGSHDIELEERFVPRGRTVSLTGDRPVAAGALYRFPVFALLALGVAAVGLGIARASLDELARLAADKVPTGMRRRLADRAAIQSETAQAEARLGAARAFLFETVGEAWDAAARDPALSVERRARLRLAATHAAIASASVVDAAWNAGGGSSIYEESPLQRQFRDVHVVTQHMMVSPATWELAGRVLLGVDVDTSML